MDCRTDWFQSTKLWAVSKSAAAASWVESATAPAAFPALSLSQTRPSIQLRTTPSNAIIKSSSLPTNAHSPWTSPAKPSSWALREWQRASSTSTCPTRDSHFESSRCYSSATSTIHARNDPSCSSYTSNSSWAIYSASSSSQSALLTCSTTCHIVCNHFTEATSCTQIKP